MSAKETLDILEQLKAMAARMEQPLKERAVQEAVDGGAAVAVRPWSFRHPLKGESDPWFGMSYHQWLGLRNEGFEGIYTPGDVESDRAVLFIIYDRAAEFLGARSGEQAAKLRQRAAVTAHLREAKSKRREEAA